MTESSEGLTKFAVRTYAEARQVVERLFEVANPRAVFGEPVTVGDRVVITASEATVSMGFGVGFGSTEPPAELVEEEERDVQDVGGGGGGGGFSSSRPIAVISVDPSGVKVEPIMDLTKVVLAFFTMIGGMVALSAKMRKAGQG